MPEHDFIDVSGGDTGVGQRVGLDTHHEALDGFGIELAERRVGPSDDVGGHGFSPRFRQTDQAANLPPNSSSM
jgi:hypothetical protein